jgi:UPF0271 protein
MRQNCCRWSLRRTWRVLDMPVSPGDIWQTLQLARRYGVVIGAHPGYFDREHFGRRGTDTECGTIAGRIAVSDCRVACPGGRSRRCRGLSQTAWCPLQSGLPRGSAGGTARRMRQTAGLANRRIARFATGKMCPSSGSTLCARRICRPSLFTRWFSGAPIPPEAFVTDPTEAVQQILRLVEQQGIETVCVHGDRPGVVEFTRSLREELARCGLEIAPWFRTIPTRS